MIGSKTPFFFVQGFVSGQTVLILITIVSFSGYSYPIPFQRIKKTRSPSINDRDVYNRKKLKNSRENQSHYVNIIRFANA